jgi:hypothetical protein
LKITLSESNAFDFTHIRNTHKPTATTIPNTPGMITFNPNVMTNIQTGHDGWVYLISAVNGLSGHSKYQIDYKFGSRIPSPDLGISGIPISCGKIFLTRNYPPHIFNIAKRKFLSIQLMSKQEDMK